MDGGFGSHTDAALRRFQRYAGMTPDGVVGSGTLARCGADPALADLAGRSAAGTGSAIASGRAATASIRHRLSRAHGHPVQRGRPGPGRVRRLGLGRVRQPGRDRASAGRALDVRPPIADRRRKRPVGHGGNARRSGGSDGFATGPTCTSSCGSAAPLSTRSPRSGVSPGPTGPLLLARARDGGGARAAGGAWPELLSRRSSSRGGGARARAGGRCVRAPLEDLAAARRVLDRLAPLARAARRAPPRPRPAALSSSSETPSRSFRRSTSRSRSTSRLGVEAVRARARARRTRQQADLLVVADRARRRPDEARDVADAQQLRGRVGGAHRLDRRVARAALRASATGWCAGRRSETHGAEQRGRGEHPQRDVHVVDERRRASRPRGPW